jgi:biotin operon repressor
VDVTRRILAYLSRRKSVAGGELRAHLGFSRQALSLHLRHLLQAGQVVRSGTTRGARYTLAGRIPADGSVSRHLLTQGLDEDRVWENLAVRLNLGRALRPHVEAIVRYAFTEMLNNAMLDPFQSHICQRVLRSPGSGNRRVSFHRVKAGFPGRRNSIDRAVEGPDHHHA